MSGRTVEDLGEDAGNMTYEERKNQVKHYLGKTVTVRIDRPVGSVHPKHPEVIYPINYGYIPGVIGGDGEELDVYVLGPREPLEEFTGKVIAVVHRENDIEDKLVASDGSEEYDQASVASAVMFQERFYRFSIDSLCRKSCGVIVYRLRGGVKEYLLLLQRRSHTWSFPKGHMEAGESEEQTALRELREETGLTAGLLPGFRAVTDYSIAGIYKKTVVLFMAKSDGTPSADPREISEYRWVTAEAAKELMYPQYSGIINAAESFGCALCV